MTRKRRRLDFYPTPGWAANVLWRRLPPTLESVVPDIGPRLHALVPRQFTWAEPCVGAGDLITGHAPTPEWTNDVDHNRRATYHRNAAHDSVWADLPAVDWVISNPPFNVAARVLRPALAHARVGVAFLLRLSFLEPTEERRGLLMERPPTRLIVLPRISFTGDGNTDSVTCAWMIWSAAMAPGVEVVKGPTKLVDMEGP